MNKIYKLIWSKTKNCYIVASELAKSHTKAPKSGVMSRALVVGILVSFFGSINAYSSVPINANHLWFYTADGYNDIYINTDANGYLTSIQSYITDTDTMTPSVDYTVYVGGSVTRDQIISALGYTPIATDTNTTYSAGNGLILSGTTFSVKAGTGITVDGNGVSITPGNVASGNANAITGGTAYSELRPANGTFVKLNQTTATNLTALDTASKNAIKGLSSNANIITYTKGDGTTGTISTSAKYVGINSSNGTNQSGEGATGADSVAIGKNASTESDNSIIIGKDAKAKVIDPADVQKVVDNGDGTTTIVDGLLSSDDTIVIGNSASATGGIAIGSLAKNGDYDNHIGAAYGIAIGSNAINSANYGLALGSNASVSEIAEYSIALGSCSVATTSRVLSVGNDTLKRRIINVEDGVNDSDAFTVGQFKTLTTPANNGLYVKQTNTVAQNLSALDGGTSSSVKALTVDGNILNYIRNDGSSVSVSLPINVHVEPGASDTQNSTMFSKTTTVGSVTAFASNSSPTGYLLCDGRAVSRTKYAALFAKIGTTYGAGDGRTTFNLPNLVGRFIEGNNSSGQYVSAGLPNITGQFGVDDRGTWVGVNGAFYLSYLDGVCGSDGDGYGYAIGFDASRSNSMYGRSSTVQPESLMMQYYIKTEDEMYNIRYLGINSAKSKPNEFGEGALGTDSIALGVGAKSNGNNSVAIGVDSVTTEADTISFGHKYTDTDIAGNQYTSNLTRRLINVSEGKSGSDAATVSQTVQVNDGFNSKVNITGLSPIGQHMVQIDVRGEGLVRSANTGLISGGTLFTEVRQPSDGNYVKKTYTSADNVRTLDTQAKINADAIVQERNDRVDAVNAEANARNLADTALSDRIGVQDDDGNYIASSLTNSVSDNIALLDTQLKTTTDNLAQEITDRRNDIRNESTTRSLADNELSARIGSQSSDGNYIKSSNINNVSDNISVLDTQLKIVSDSLSEEIDNRTSALQNEKEARITQDTELSNRIDELSGTTVQYDSSSKTKITLEGSNGTIISNVRAGNIGPNSMDAINGSQLYRTNELIGTIDTDGNIIQKDASISQNLVALDSNLNTISQQFTTSDEVSVKYDSALKNMITLGGTGGTVIDNLADGIIAQGSMQAITGSQMWEFQNYLNSEIANSVERDNTLNQRINQLSGTLDNAILYDNEDGTIATLKGSRGTTLKNVRAGEISNTSQDAINGSQLYAVKEDIRGFASAIQKNASNIQTLNTSVSSALSSVAASGLLVDTIDLSKADSSLNNLTESGKQVLKQYASDAVQEYMAKQNSTAPMFVGYSNNTSTANNTLTVTDAGNGSLHVGEGSYVNGTSSIAIGVGNQVNANNSGAFGDPSIINADASYVLGNDDTINTGATGSFIVGNDGVSDAQGGLLFGSNTKATAEAENGLALGNRSEVSAKNAIALGSSSIADSENTLSIGNSELKRKIVNVADGDISQNSSEVVTGAQLFVTNEKVQKNTEAIEKKADVDASNIDTSAWAAKLGTGVVVSGNSNLVTGGAVYDAIGTAMANTVTAVSASVPIKVGENDAILIGHEYGGEVVSVVNKDGEGRIVTGVLTNPEDKSSAANVGYVQAIGENIVSGVNGALSAVDSKINKVGANAAALASLNPGSLDGDEKFGVAAAVGNYRDATAGAVGLFYKPQDNITMNVRGSFGTDENMVGAGVYVALNKGDTPGVSKSQMVKTINAQANEITKIKQMNVQLQAEHKAEIEAVRGENAELREMVLNMQQQLNALQTKQ